MSSSHGKQSSEMKERKMMSETRMMDVKVRHSKKNQLTAQQLIKTDFSKKLDAIVVAP